MTQRNQLPRAPEKESLPARLSKEASRQALSARLRAAKHGDAPQKEKLSWEEWIKRHPLLFLLYWTSASLVLGFAHVQYWSFVVRQRLFNPFEDWVACVLAVVLTLWSAGIIFMTGIAVWTDWMR